MEFPSDAVSIMEEEKEVGDTEGKFASLEENLDVKEEGKVLTEVNDRKPKRKRGRPPKKDKEKKIFSEENIVMEENVDKEESEEKNNNLVMRGRANNDVNGKQGEIDSEREEEEKEKGDSDEVTCGERSRKNNDVNGKGEEEKQKIDSNEVTGRTRKSSQMAMEKLKGFNQQMAEWDEEDRKTGRKRRGQSRKGGRKTEDNGDSEKIGSKKRRRKRSKDAAENGDGSGGDSAEEESREQQREMSKKNKAEGEEKVEGSESRYSTRQRKDVHNNALNPRNRKRKDENGNEFESNMCHQCQRNDKGRVVRCTRCTTKRYCVPCMSRWYPGMPEEAFAESCPVCRQNCNCKSCLRLDGPIRTLKNLKFEICEEEKSLYSKFILQKLLPFLRRFNAEQVMEMEIEARIQGIPVSELKLHKAKCQKNERMYCNNCKTSIVDFHRNCSSCSYDLCLTCCRELRDGHLKGGEEEVILEFTDKGLGYLHAEEVPGDKLKNLRRTRSSKKEMVKNDSVEDAKLACEMESKDNGGLLSEKFGGPAGEWKSNEDGSIPCPPENFGGCGKGILELNCLLTKPCQVTELLAKAEDIAKRLELEYMPEIPHGPCLCRKSVDENDMQKSKMCKAASRDDFDDNYLYCPAAKDLQQEDLKHFQCHWLKGEPVIVRNVLETASGLSWEPMVMWRACRQIKNLNHPLLLDVIAINCLDWCEVEVNIHQFFKGYMEGRFDDAGWPQILKLKDWPPSDLFDERLPRHGAEFVSSLPFKEYTHPQSGYLNLAVKLPKESLKPDENWVAVGNGKGTMVIARVVDDVLNPRVELMSTWSAEPERQLLGTYWCKSLGPKFLFTSDPRGTLKLWRLFNPLPSVSQDVMRRCCVSLIAEFRSCFGMRIMCLDASVENEVLVCGDIRGNLLLFPLQRDILFSMSTASEINISPFSNFRGAHGISTVCSISIASFGPTQLEIHSTGGDGCICYFEHDRSRHNLEFVGIKQVKELSTVRSIFTNADQQGDLPGSSCAIGFSSSDFIIWNLFSETKVLRVTCGGWRRPHSYFLGDVPEMKNCFAYVKDGIIYVHRHWVTTRERVMYPKNLHLQFHGREIHTLCFISQDSSCSLNEKQDIFSEMIWVATGCEDGTVRLTRYASEIENWSTSKLLGEHVGGSAVRSIFFVSRLHRMVLDENDMPDSVNSEKGFLEDPEDLSLLLSVGAKRVVTAWKQKSKMRIREGTFDPECNIRNDFQWLSTDMPTRERNHGKLQNNKKVSEMVENGGSLPSEDKRSYSEPCVPDICENDWRYLAVTAFLAQVAGTRCSVCFVVVACSDATVTLRALLLPYRLWFDVALLSPLSSPVLALQHIIVPTYPPLQGNVRFGSRYIIISGSTDGSIAFWDLSEHVENFMRQLSAVQIRKGLDSQKRPRTGRGSQGGRQWRSLGSQVSNKITGEEQLLGVPVTKGKPDNGLSATTVPGTDKTVQDHTLRGISHLVENTHAFSPDTFTGIKEVLHKAWPLHIFKDVHQSGVNCLHVSDIKGPEVSDSRFTFCVLSGGDDQSLNCLRLDFSLKSLRPSCESSTSEQHSTTGSLSVGGHVHYYEVGNYDMRFALLDKVMSAHSSAVKGVWTDGCWVFSTGLDQRIRCWHLEQQGKLTEHKHMVVSVPEPEALDARACGRNHYQIAVAGRGMQMFDFVAPDEMKGGN